MPCEGTEHPCPLEQVRESGQPVTVVHEHYQASGARRVVEIVASPLWGEDGAFQGIIESIRDVTERKRAEEALRRRLQELVVLHTVATIGAKATSEDTLLADITSAMDGVLDVDRFSVWLLDETADVLRAPSPTSPPHRRERATGLGTQQTSALYGERTDKEGKRRVIPPDVVYPPGHGIAGQVAVDGQPRRVSDLTSESEPLATKAALEDRPTNARPMRSELCVPLIDDRRIIGVIDAASARPGAFSEADERLLETLASQLVTAIEKVRLLETLEQRVAGQSYRRRRWAAQRIPNDAVLCSYGKALECRFSLP